ncbi:hypothetical protein KQX54_010612, partial [Cotesia glomerata]
IDAVIENGIVNNEASFSGDINGNTALQKVSVAKTPFESVVDEDSDEEAVDNGCSFVRKPFESILDEDSDCDVDENEHSHQDYYDPFNDLLDMENSNGNSLDECQENTDRSQDEEEEDPDFCLSFVLYLYLIKNPWLQTINTVSFGITVQASTRYKPLLSSSFLKNHRANPRKKPRDFQRVLDCLPLLLPELRQVHTTGGGDKALQPAEHRKLPEKLINVKVDEYVEYIRQKIADLIRPPKKTPSEAAEATKDDKKKNKKKLPKARKGKQDVSSSSESSDSGEDSEASDSEDDTN